MQYMKIKMWFGTSPQSKEMAINLCMYEDWSKISKISNLNAFSLSLWTYLWEELKKNCTIEKTKKKKKKKLAKFYQIYHFPIYRQKMSLSECIATYEDSRCAKKIIRILIREIFQQI